MRCCKTVYLIFAGITFIQMNANDIPRFNNYKNTIKQKDTAFQKLKAKIVNIALFSFDAFAMFLLDHQTTSKAIIAGTSIATGTGVLFFSGYRLAKTKFTINSAEKIITAIIGTTPIYAATTLMLLTLAGTINKLYHS